MAVSITIPTTLRAFTNGLRHVDLDADTVGGALDELTTRHPLLRSQLFTDDTLRAFVNVFVNDENMRDVGGRAAHLRSGDSLSIIPSIAGG